MPDVIDIILDKLSASSLELLDEINLNGNRESEYYSEELVKSLDAMESFYLNECTDELNNKSELLISETRRLKNLFDKYNEQFKKLKIVGDKDGNSKETEAYNEELDILEKKLNNLTTESGGLEPEELFVKIEKLLRKTESLEGKSDKIKERLKHYENFPPSVTEGQYCLDDLKRRIKEKEAALEKKMH